MWCAFKSRAKVRPRCRASISSSNPRARANFGRVVEALTQGRAERILKSIQEAEADWHTGKKTLDVLHGALGWMSRVGMELADGVPLMFDGLMGEATDRRFPRSSTIWKPKLSFDPQGASETNQSWAQKGLDEIGPYDRQSFAAKHLRIAVVCEATERALTEVMVDHLLKGLPEVRSSGPNPLKPHESGLIGRFRLGTPEVRFFEADDDGAGGYTEASRRALAEATARDERWDLALVQVQRVWRERAYENSPYWASKATFLKRETPVQALSIDLSGLEDLGYASALANMSLAIYAKLGGVPWLLPSRTTTCEQAWNFDPRVRGIGVQL